MTNYLLCFYFVLRLIAYYYSFWFMNAINDLSFNYISCILTSYSSYESMISVTWNLSTYDFIKEIEKGKFLFSLYLSYKNKGKKKGRTKSSLIANSGVDPNWLQVIEVQWLFSLCVSYWKQERKQPWRIKLPKMK